MGNFNFASFIDNAAVLTAVLIFGALGGLTSERSGVMNIGLEGKMLSGACACAVVASNFNNAYAGLFVGILVAIALSVVHWLLTQHYQIDHIISGMAINLVALGGTKFAYGKLMGGTGRSGFPMVSVLIYELLAVAAVIGLSVYVVKTRGGLRLWAVGNDPDKTRLVGIKPVQVRLISLLWTGIFCGLAGGLLVTNAGGFTDGMTAGKGYIALAALILGGWRPIPTLVACLAFGMIDGLQLQFQGVLGIPSEAWNALPYLLTLITIAALYSKNRTPAGLGQP